MRDEPDIIKEMKLYEKSFYHNTSDMNEEEQNSNNSPEYPVYNSMLTSVDQKKEIDTLIESSDFNVIYKLLIENIFEGLVILDFESKITYVNESFKEMFGLLSNEDVIGKSFIDFIDKEYCDDFLHAFQDNNSDTECFYGTYKALNMQQSLLWIEVIGCNFQQIDHTDRIVFLKDVTKQKKKLEEISFLEKRYKAIVDMSADGIIIIDPLGKISYTNTSFENMTQKSKSELLETLFRSYISEDYVYISQQLFMKARKTKHMIKHFEMELISGNSIYPIELSISPLFEDETFNGYICTVRDITEQKNFEDEIRKSERLKTEFMNIAAHELKSPVTPIKGYLELIISDKDANDKIKKWAKISLRNAERLLYLVNDILDVSRLDNDTMKFEMRKIDAQELIDEIVEDFKPAIENKNLTLETNIQAPLPSVLGDYHRLNQVLKNLFTNALKFTDEGSITLSAVHADKKLRITVEDTGIGMNEMNIHKIFEKFYQAETCDSRKHEGTGLGLFICKEILKKHNGTISVDSKQGVGSSFTITLPIL